MEAQILSLATQLEEAKAGKIDASDSGMQDSFLTLQKENMQLLERLQKTENTLSKVRSGEDPADDETKESKTITLSPEVSARLEDLDSRMVEIKRELHQAKSSCLKDLTGKYSAQISEARRTFSEEALLQKAVSGDKVSGWNNIVKECKSLKFGEKSFLLVQDVSEPESTFYLVDEARVTETAVKYLKAFVEDYDNEEFI